MFFIKKDSVSEKNIETLASSEEVFKRGVSYYNRDNVGALDWNDDRLLVEAEVFGSEVYNTHVSFSKEGDIQYPECTCYAFSSYEGLCKHLVATLLEINYFVSKPTSPLAQPKTSTGLELISAFQKQFQVTKSNQQQRVPLIIEFELFFSTDYYNQLIETVDIRARVGEKRLYVIQDLASFVHSVHLNIRREFTKNFTLDPLIHEIQPEDRAILELIMKIDTAKQSTHMYKSSRNKNYSIPLWFIHELFELLTQRNVVTSYRSPRPQPLNILSAEQYKPIDIALTKLENDELASLQLLQDYDFFSKEFQAIMSNNTLFLLTKDQASVLETLVINKKFNENRTLAEFHQSEMEAFCSIILPQIKQVANVEIDQELASLIQSEPLQAKLHLDTQNGLLSADLTFQYGTHTIHPLESKEENSDNQVILVRDIKKEAVIFDLLHAYPFTRMDNIYLLDDDDLFAPFLFEQVPVLQEYMEVFTTSGIRQMITPLNKPPVVSIAKNDQSNWLDIQFSLDGIPADEMSEVLQALRNKQTYYKLNSGAFINFKDNQFNSMKDALTQFGPEKAALSEHLSVPLYKALSLEEESAAAMKLSSQLRDLLRNIGRPDYMEGDKPDGITADLREYQLTGYRWMTTLESVGLGGVLADDMGLGKTLQTITFIQGLLAKRSHARIMIIAPASLIYNWQREFERFAPGVDVELLVGSKAERSKKKSESTASVWITSYPLIQRDSELYSDQQLDVLILDEAQAIKNDTSKTAKSVRSIQASSSFALTGTPIENRLDELYSLFHTLLPGSLGTKKGFKEMESADIAKRVRPFILRRMKKDVLTELPDKIEQTQYIDLTDDQKKLYAVQVKELTKDVEEASRTGQFQEKRMQFLAGLTKLRQICCHPHLITSTDKSYTSGKLDRLVEYVEEGLAAGQRMVIFSQFTSMLAIIRETFDQKEWRYHYLDGQTPTDERLQLTERFNEGEHELFLISMKAGGTGLNLTGGDTVILYDTWWNPAVEQQAADRVYRFGQKKNVQVVKLISTGTIEEKMLALQEKKKHLIEEVIQSGEQKGTSLTADEIKELLQM
ncbi:DEAD/DEAH box helicase [Alkalicoccobacillus murimartini]|uniref:Superfamily II DNA or RNA helicase n=1 Tax=Alkalicoccobacillus murimartini TaxID=171685 RepID=A0ABT9YLL9_9BACI|nr:DEAD/DEAH box helicase [Alkalicoccobacillus murimartini]MDQ0208380.1 superfamily II DNA or RNA helicase [Alkalicoccobacillus murimartini]